MPAPRETGVPVNVLQSLSITYQSATPALAGQMVDFTGNLVTSSTTPIYGVLREDAVQGRTVSIAVAGLVEILSGAAIAVGALIGSDATGKGVTVAVNNQTFARATTACAAANQKFQAYITREGTY